MNAQKAKARALKRHAFRLRELRVTIAGAPFTVFWCHRYGKASYFDRQSGNLKKGIAP